MKASPIVLWTVENEADGDPERNEVRACAALLAARTSADFRVLVPDEGRLGPYAPALYARAVADHVLGETPDDCALNVVLLPHTYQVAEFAPLLATVLDAAYVPSISAVNYSVDDGLGFRRPVNEGRLEADVEVEAATVVATIQSGKFRTDESGPEPARVVRVGRPADLHGPPERKLLGIEAPGAATVDLSGARRIVAAGRGVGGPDGIAVAARLAEVLEAELGASRPVVDSGWLPQERQVGSSGQIVAPDLYLALGVSGSIQHLMGMSGSQVIVAVNTDPGAPIFSVAKYGIIGDLHEVAPALSRLLAKRRID